MVAAQQQETASAYEYVLDQYENRYSIRVCIIPFYRLVYDANYIQSKLASLIDIRNPFLFNITLFSTNVTYYLQRFLCYFRSNLGIDILNMSSCITMDSRCQLTNSMYEQYQKIMQDFNSAKIQLQNRYL